jgi:hypothetical protein
MITTIVTVSLALVLGEAGQAPAAYHCPQCHGTHAYPAQPGNYPHYQKGHLGSGGFILPNGPGYGWGFPNKNPDGFGWFDPGPLLPLGANRTTEYFFPRYLVAPPEQMFLGTYYNPYINRGQRYLPYTGDGGCHPMGGPPLDSAITPVRPYSALSGAKPVTSVPRLNGRVDAPIENSGKTGLTP